MYQARLTKSDASDAAEPPDDDPPPVVTWPNTAVIQYEIEGRTIVQMRVPADVLANLEAGNSEIELQVVSDEGA